MPYESHAIYDEPAIIQKLWRYMNLAKFVSLLQKKAIYLPSLCQLSDDPWEGLPSALNFSTARPISITENNGNNSHTYLGSLSYIESRYPGFVHRQKQVAMQIRKMLYANCWHMNDNESDAQWKIYGESIFSLAIVTNFEKLKNSINDNKIVHGTKVTYIDHNRDCTPEENILYNAMYKRNGFIHEKEFRLVFIDQAVELEKIPFGIFISVDLNILIEKIIVSPQAPQWFLETIHRLILDYGLTVKCEKSDFLTPLM